METLTMPLTAVSTLAWVALALQVALLVAGIYLAFVRQDAKALRGTALKRLGYALLGLGALGMVVCALLAGLIAPFNSWIWITIVLIFELALAVFAVYYSQRIYPQEVAALQASQRSARRPVPPRAVTSTENGSTTAGSTVRPASSRRDSRRSNKRSKGKR